MTERAVEKHTNSIFAKLGLSEERDVNRRVKAVLVYLSQPGRRSVTGVGWVATPGARMAPPSPAARPGARLEL